MPKLKKPKLKKRIVRNEETFKLEWKKVRLSIEVPEYVRDEFKKAVEKALYSQLFFLASSIISLLDER